MEKWDTSPLLEQLVSGLSKKGIIFDSGLCDDEVTDIERKFWVIFPPDLASLLREALPISEWFPNWRLWLISDIESALIFTQIDWPLEGILFDVKENDFWIPEWGEKPRNESQSEPIIRAKFATYPKLVPIYKHRYIPYDPNEEGNPVFSIYQSDIVPYGENIYYYLEREFGVHFPKDRSNKRTLKIIPFWSNPVEN